MAFNDISKQRFSTISNNEFKFAGREEEILFFLFHKMRITPFSFYKLDHELAVQEFPNPSDEGLWLCNEKTRLLGSCDGFLLLSAKEYIYLWNPTTKSCKLVHHLRYLGDPTYNLVASGLCYDESRADYKVILAFYCTRIDVWDVPDYREKFVLVASLKNSEEGWTEISSPFDFVMNAIGMPFHFIPTHTVGTLVNGNLHWVTNGRKGKLDSHDDAQLIVYFNTKNTKFEELPKPEIKHGEQNLIYGLGVLDGCLSMARQGKNCCEVLVMKKYGVKESWNTLFTITNLLLKDVVGSLVPVFVRKNGEVVLVENSVKVWAYNPKEESILDIELPQEDRCLKGFVYVGSLASVYGNTFVGGSLGSVKEGKISWIDQITLVDE